GVEAALPRRQECRLAVATGCRVDHRHGSVRHSVRPTFFGIDAMNRAMQTQAKITEPMIPLRRQTRRRRVWPTSKLCKGGPLAPRSGGYGLDRACCTASVGHQGIDGGVRLMPGPTTIPPSQKSLTQNICHSPHSPTVLVIPPKANSAFVAAMEDVLAVYTRPHDPD